VKKPASFPVSASTSHPSRKSKLPPRFARQREERHKEKEFKIERWTELNTAGEMDPMRPVPAQITGVNNHGHEENGSFSSLNHYL